MNNKWFSTLVAIVVVLSFGQAPVSSQEFIPRTQTKPPGPPLSPSDALKRMTVPEGFHVELVASEPDLMNPVAMAFDDRGRIYVTESFEYPRRDPGPGRDRIKILEDTDHDGRVDSVKIFADGLNIPSGIAVGYGGVWVANAPDILFLEDTDGDDRADKQTVVVTGFGRDDTHELPNALTWGPDGMLYGLNGVFNRSVVKQDGRTYSFTCAMFRIDPVTRRFDLFCEGTSNPWGIAFDNEGSAFISACVIDHLWHLTETGYYHRQGGPYPPHTWKIESIVNYSHQLAAYCGIEYFDSPAYPAEFRNKLYMGNIHGGCINVDSVARSGSTYKGTKQPDFLTGNDVWFMPVAQKVGPDGCLYILDWYDRYHCYQDASADPQGVDRGHGRLYRVVYGNRPTIKQPDLQKLADPQLVALLSDDNIFYRQRAQVVLNHRLRTASDSANILVMQAMFDELSRSSVLGGIEKPPALLPLLSTYLYAPDTKSDSLLKLLDHSDPKVVAWVVRAIGGRIETDLGSSIQSTSLLQKISSLAKHADPRVRLQVAITAGKMPSLDATEVLLDILAASQDDGLIPRIVWRNLEPRVESNQAKIVSRLSAGEGQNIQLLNEMMPRIATRLMSNIRPDLSGERDAATLEGILGIASTLSRPSPSQTDLVLEAVLSKLRTGEIRQESAKPILVAWNQKSESNSLAVEQLRAFAGEERSIELLGQALSDRQLATELRRNVLATLATVRSDMIGQAAEQLIDDLQNKIVVNSTWRDAVLDTVIRRGNSINQAKLVAQLPKLPIGVQATIAERMSQRETTAQVLLDAIASQKLGKEIVGPNQVKQLAASRSQAIQQAVQKIWGTVRTQDSAERQKIVRDMTDFLVRDARGNATRGLAVYDRVCGQCHILHNRGYEVGPTITRNGRGSFEQLIVSVFDPSLVIGDAYKSSIVLTVDGRILNGLVIEQTDQRLVLKVQGGKQEVLPMSDVETIKKSDKSLMPEGLETQLTRPELADLFALLSLENPIESKENDVIAGTPKDLHSR